MLATSLPKLQASPPADLSFSKISQVRAFVLERDAGNLLVYAAATMTPELAGDVRAQYLNHWHELAVGGAGSVHAPLHIHAADRAVAEDTHPVAHTFDARTTLDDDFELVPIPGHTPGATAFLWDSGDHRMLFTGDSLYLRGDEWIVAVLADSDRDAYIESLQLIAELDFDVLVPWAAAKDGPHHAFTNRAHTRRRIDAILKRLARGEAR
jgi:glyoxylase-like metal-dependent hydrolase (beta-lactamase superfamily II)